MARSTVQIFLASSIDGFIAGPNHDLSWLPDGETVDGEAPTESVGDSAGAVQYDEFIGGIGALLMGRSTYDVVRGFGVDWPYGERPVLVATSRPLDDDPPSTVQAVSGSIGELIQEAKNAAGNKGVYLDGGNLIRQAAEEDLIDELIISMAPVALGQGIPLFAGLEEYYALEIVSHHSLAHGMVQLRLRPKSRSAEASALT